MSARFEQLTKCTHGNTPLADLQRCTNQPANHVIQKTLGLDPENEAITSVIHIGLQHGTYRTPVQ